MKKHVKPQLKASFMHVWMVSILYCTKGSRSEPEGGRRPHSGEFIFNATDKTADEFFVPIVFVTFYHYLLNEI